METLSSCPVCNNKSFIHFLTCKDYTTSQENFDIISCDSCSLKFTNPRPAAAEIGPYYKSDEYISHTNSKKGLINQLYQIVRSFTLKQKVNLINSYANNKSILDYGCGTGEFLNACKNDGYTVEGFEPDSDARKLAINNYGITVYCGDELNIVSNSSKNVITLWHVLEHVHDLEGLLNNLSRILQRDGTLFIAVPNHTSYDAKLYGEYWAAYDVPIHLYHFSPETIKKLLEKFGFSLKQTLPMNFDSFYVSMLSEKYKTGATNLPKAFFNGLISNLKASGDKQNYSSQIYIFQKAK